MPIDYERAQILLQTTFSEVEADFLRGEKSEASQTIIEFCDQLFHSKTQAYREVLLGCILARLLDRTISIRQPYVNQGPSAFNGRTLDEKVVNPFLENNRIPSSQGPYLSVFRRSVEFNEATKEGLRDKSGYGAFLKVLQYAENTGSSEKLHSLLRYLLHRFLDLREQSQIELARLHRISLQQYQLLIDGLLQVPSGGRFPVLLVIATFRTIQQHFNCPWEVRFQGINVADAPSGAGGDITIVSVSPEQRVLMVAEVTERAIDKNRIVTTFNSKIAPQGIADYLFLTKSAAVSPEVREQAGQYFAQGHEINFVLIRDWIYMVLATLGTRGRATFNQELLNLLVSPEVPKALKAAWNDRVSKLTTLSTE